MLLLTFNSRYTRFSHIPFDELKTYITEYLSDEFDYEKIGTFVALYRGLIITGVALIMIGAGLMRPCMLSLSSDQFKHLHFSTTYSRFLGASHFFVNLAALISACAAPYVREMENCDNCEIGVYVTFFVAVIMAFGLLLLMATCLHTGTIKPGVQVVTIWGCIKVRTIISS